MDLQMDRHTNSLKTRLKRDRHIHRYTERQLYSETDGHTEGKIDLHRHSDTQTYSRAERHPYIRMDIRIQTYQKKDLKRGRHIHRYTERQVYSETDGHAEGQIHRHTDTQT